jgi:citrate synthase
MFNKDKNKRDIRLMMWALPANGHPMDVLQTTIASMATFYPDAGAQDPNSAYTQSALTKIIIEYPRYAKIPFLPSIEEMEDSVAGTPAKPGIYSIINNKLNV